MQHSYRKLLATILLAVVASQAIALEGPSPLLQGSITGKPLGALPPEPGLYASLSAYQVYANKLRVNNGDSIPFHFNERAISLSLLYSSGASLLGAKYGAGIIQPVSYRTANASAVGGEETRHHGFFNTIVTPLILSWQTGESTYLSFSQSIYLKDGDYRSTTLPDGSKVRDGTSWANNFWTFEPSASITSFRNSYTLSTTLTYDYNTKNKQTGYKSGQTLYLDTSIVKNLPNHFRIGALLHVTRQITSDAISGRKVGPHGNEQEHVMPGVLVGYHFDSGFDVELKGFRGVRTRNDLDTRNIFVSVSKKIL